MLYVPFHLTALVEVLQHSLSTGNKQATDKLQLKLNTNRIIHIILSPCGLTLGWVGLGWGGSLIFSILTVRIPALLFGPCMEFLRHDLFDVINEVS